jgi:DNA polymerase-3 subunit alpha
MRRLGLLHTHSEFSARDSLIRVHELPKLAKENGWSSCALTDHGAVEGTLPFLAACKEHGVKPICGVELYISTAESQKHQHLTVLAKNAKGFSAICAAISAGTDLSKGNKKRIAACPIDTALEVLNNVVILSGCISSPFWRGWDVTGVPGGSQAAREDLARWVDKFGEDFFFEVQPLDDWFEQIKLNKVVQEAAHKFNRPIVVTPDCHFGTAEDGRLHEALLAFGNRAVLGSGDDKWKFSTKLNYLMTPEETGRRLSRAGFSEDDAAQAVLNTEIVSDRITEWSFDDLPKHQIPIVDGDFNEITRAAFGKRDFSTNQDYIDRLNEELKVFTEAGLGSYFLLVNECLRLFREDGAMLGPRGSIAGCLVAYVLGISNIDPVLHNLPYWRWWYPGRSKSNMPDADIDLSQEYHPRVLARLRERFGNDKVAQISTVGTFGIRLAVRSAAKTFGIKVPDHDDWLNDPEAPEAYWLYHELPVEAREFALKLIGRVEKYGAHPGGVVISTDSLAYGRSCIVRRGKNTAMCWDMESAEKLGFLKIDFLGNASMDALKALSEALNIHDVEEIPLEDPEVMKDFRRGVTAGIPQFSTPGMRTFTEMIQPQDFKDLVWCNGAFRAGAFGEGRGPKEVAAAFHESGPDSVLIFQEDMMLSCREIAGLSWEETDKIRKIVAKSQGNVELAKWRDRFIDGCVKVGTLTRNEAEVLFETFSSAGSYLFNRSHAAAYSANAYRIAWMKRREPVRAFVALLNVEKDANRESLLDEVDEFKIQVVPPDPNKSGFSWTTDGDRILTPLQHAQGSDLRIAKAIVLRRTVREVKKGKKTVTVGGPFKDQADFTARMGSMQKLPVKSKSGKVTYKAKGIMRPDWFDQKFWNPAPRRTETPTRPDKGDGEVFREVVSECERCKLRAVCTAPVPPEFGRTNVLVLGDAPGRREDGRSKPFIGRAGEMLFNLLYNEGIDRKDLTLMYTTSCLPGSPETADEVTCPWATSYIENFKPPLVLAVGRRAWQLVSGLGKSAPGITKVNGTFIWKDGMGIVPMVSPGMILQDERLMPEIERAARKFSKLFRSSLGL